MIKILGIAGSPRKGGNSDILINAFLDGSKSKGFRVEKINVCDYKIAPCNENNACHKTGICTIRDDMQWIYSKILNADHIVISTPTFFMGPSAQLKAVIDRCQALWARKFLLKKALREDKKKRNGFLLATAGLKKKEAFDGTKNIIKALFYVLDFKYKNDLLFGGVDNRGDIKNKKGALEKAFKLGTRVDE